MRATKAIVLAGKLHFNLSTGVKRVNNGACGRIEVERSSPFQRMARINIVIFCRVYFLKHFRVFTRLLNTSKVKPQNVSSDTVVHFYIKHSNHPYCIILEYS